VGLIAHQLENAGIPTVSVSSARDITQAVGTPRASFLDFPLGHTTGKAGDPVLSYEIIFQAVSLIERITGTVLEDLPQRWSESDSWKDDVFPEGGSGRIDNDEVVDDRLDRWDQPQYQSRSDLDASLKAHIGQDCKVCKGIDY
tara:strand:+ start:2625 stop:3053 length:429 start_codon:yes stop_codon:yes gene_type:complete